VGLAFLLTRANALLNCYGSDKNNNYNQEQPQHQQQLQQQPQQQ
jgi:hypothetical protein